MKKILEAHELGRMGKEALPTATKAQRLAHRMGSNAFKSHERKAIAMNTLLHAEKEAEFNEAIAKAQGTNKLVLDIMKEAAALPQRASKPLWGTRFREADGTVTQNRTATFHFGEDQDPSRPGKTPLAADMGRILIDSPDWSHNGINMPVDSLSITNTARLGANNEVIGVSSVLFFNSRPYNPENIVFGDTNEFTGQARIDINEEGQVEAIGLSRDQRTGYTPSDSNGERVTVDLEKFLENVRGAVIKTAVSEMDKAFNTEPGIPGSR